MEIGKAIFFQTTDGKRLFFIVDGDNVVIVHDYKHVLVLPKEQWEKMCNDVEDYLKTLKN